jgi:WhiB family transcriptional regulator, redox-sensing transcriptional regulator
MVATTGSASQPTWLSLAELVDAKTVLRSEAWRARAAWRGQDADWWHPPRGAAHREQVRICETCDVRIACLQYALDNHEPLGIWGGVSEDPGGLSTGLR